MFKKFLLITFSLLMTGCAFAIDWVNVEAPNGSNALLDIDSIKEYDRYVFYNIKVFNKYTGKNTVITMQSSLKKGFTARIKYYTDEEYKNLNGDYDNITNNITHKYETVQYGSIAHSCYLKVKSIVEKSKIQIAI